MSKRLKQKSVALAIAVAVCTLAMGLLLASMQTRLSQEEYALEFDRVAAELPALVKTARSETKDNTQTFDDLYRTRAASIAFMAANDAGYEATDAKMAEFKNLLKVDNVLIARRDGSIIAKAADTKADFSRARFNLLRQCFETGKPSDPVEVDLPDQDWLMRYYAAKIDDDTMVIVEQNPQELHDLVKDTGSTESTLKNISLGSHGYVLAVSAKTHLITYHPDQNMIGTDALDHGIDMGNLEDGKTFVTSVKNTSLYCRVKLVDDTYYVLAIPESDTATARNITVGVILFAFIAIVAAVALYDLFVLADDEHNDHGDHEYVKIGRDLRFNPAVGRRATALSVAGLVLLLAVTFYMQTLFALSSQATVNRERIEQIDQTLKNNAMREDELTRQYSEHYATACHIIAYIVEHNPELATRADLHGLAETLNIESIYLYDGDGNMTSSSTSQRSYSLSTKYGDSSYEFRSLLGGKDEYIQPLSINRTTGETYQYIGVALYDQDGIADGIAQIAVRPMRLEEMLKSTKIDAVLDGIKAGAGGFAFAIDKKDDAVAYHPNNLLVGKKASEIGLTDEHLADGFNDFVYIDNQKLYASCLETGDYYVYVAAPEDSFMHQRVPLTIATGIIAAICFALIYPLLTLDTIKVEEHHSKREGDVSARRQNITVTTSDGRVKNSESAIGRWLNISFKWEDKTPEQKLGTVLRWFTGIAVFIVFLAVLFKDTLFGPRSVFTYILGNDWQHGLNIFALTASIMYACVALTVCAIAQALLRMLSNVLGARGETICRLLSSLTQYGTLIAMLYWCLGVLGVDTATLLASAGIITLAVSFGAKDLITDILCGLFIIFEGEFRVGDVISVGGNTGTVMEIGVRTTKINDGNGNVLLLRNSSISNVTNMTKLNSYASIDITLPVGESLPYVEKVLKDELKSVHDRVPAIIDGPFYKGVVDLSSTAMTIRVVATCKEIDRGSVMRSLRREVKLLLSRRDIAPYQLVFDHCDAVEPAPRAVTAEELAEADEFNEEQKLASQDLGNEPANQ
ncbi:mechanosensitive ion channel domain-containing protein [Collinsella aerofaciens]|uniref:mechanosensitive ion channel domain-containing protein n=1 Tax=Collinsella aerofaciens TaxID=74426 RepID=UPI00232F56B0|nr:mechanosensitive ion channel domain-containing protein [Collinsella aerofaciens]MDB1819740.1 mechanosensitive ion channel [Collinsella aerofaciens]